MKKIVNTVSNIIGGLIIIGAGIVLVLTLKGANLADEQSATFQSPIEKRVVLPTATILSPQRISPIATPTLSPMSAKATVAALGSQHKSEIMPHLVPVKSKQDIINAVISDPNFQKNLNDPMFGPNSIDTVPNEPIAVKLISKQYFGIIYYIVPFYKDGYITGLATVWVEDGMGGLGMWSNTHVKQFPPVSAIEAVNLVEKMEFKVLDEPKLVFQPTREGGGDWTSPFWEVTTEEGITFYVIHILNETKIYRSDEVHPTD